MFCVIQEIEVKKVPAGESKEIETYETTWTIGGVNGSTWGWRYGKECFERPIKKAYRISIHESYRERGKVKKRQTVICTVGYYSIIDYGSWIDDYIRGGLKSKAEALGLTEEQLSDMVYQKFQPIIDRVKAEFQQTEEYKAKEEHQHLINEHNQRIEAFIDKYGVERSEYNHCYDVFGTLRNPEYLKKIKAAYKERTEYERRSQQNSRSYYDYSYDNYSSSAGLGSLGSVRSEDERPLLKQFYRTLSKAYHPDSNPGKDTSEAMKLLNRLKTEWGV